MVDYEAMVKEFHVKFSHIIAENPTVGKTITAILRARLIEEEAKELVKSMSKGDVVGIADGIADLLYVVFGTAISFGIPIGEVFKEVHRSNMSKSNDKTYIGKTKKGPDFSPPNIKEILDNA